MQGSPDNMLLNFIIRPPRSSYPDDAADNNKKHITKKGIRYVQHVIAIKNDKGETLRCTFFEVVERPSEKMPAIIYMHGNAGNKLEAYEYASMLIDEGINLFSFDFSGCGNSEGEWVTLGWKEKNDLTAVIQYLE